MGVSFYEEGVSFTTKPERRDDTGELYDFHQGIIFAIHLTPTIYADLELIFRDLLKLIRDLAKTTPGTGLGCYLFNCANEVKNKKEARGPFAERKGIYPIFRLNDINATQLKDTNVLLEQTELGGSLENVFELLEQDPQKNYGEQLCAMFNQCQDDFTYVPKFTKPYNSRRIFLFTDQDKPFNGVTSTRTTLQRNIHDLNLAKITVIPFLMARGEQKQDQFDVKEYKILLEVGETGEIGKKKYVPSVKQISKDNIQEKIMRTSELKRNAFACPLVLGEDFRISIKGYAMFNEVKLRMPDNFYDDQGVYKLVHVKTSKVAKNTGTVLSDEDVIKAFHVGDQYFRMDDKYLSEMQSFNEEQKPILRLLGFRKIKYFNPSYTVGTSIFVVPNEDGEFTHSRRTFSALYQSLVKKRRMAVVWGMHRKMSYPTLYYLIPTAESICGRKGYPEGLAMVQIPYKDEIRTLPSYFTDEYSPVGVANPNQFDNVVQDLIRDYQPIENPQLSWHYKVFEDHILQREVPTKAAENPALLKQAMINQLDRTKVEAMKTRTEVQANQSYTKHMADLNSELNRISNVDELAPANQAIPPSKKAKMLTDDTVIKAWNLKELSQFSVAQLRSYINSKPNLIEKSKTKTGMIANITDYLERSVNNV